MKKNRLYIPMLALLVLSVLLTACDGSVSIASIAGAQAQASSPGSDKLIKAPNDGITDSSSDEISTISSSEVIDRSSEKLVEDSQDGISGLSDTSSVADNFFSFSSMDDSDDDELHLYCEVTEVTENTITLCDETFEVDTTEDLTILFMVGEFYEIEYLLNEDGSITILEFELEDSPDDDMDDNDDDLDDSDDDSNDNDDNNENYNDEDEDSNDNNDNYNNNDSENND